MGQQHPTQTGDEVREVPVQAAPTARRQGSRPPSQTAAAAAAEPVAPRRSSPAPGDRGVRIPAAAVEVFNIAAGDSEQDGPAADDPGRQAQGIISQQRCITQSPWSECGNG